MKEKISKYPVLIAALLSLPVTGLLYGFFGCDDCGNGAGGTMGRIFIAFVQAANTTLTFGFPLENEGGSSHDNVWPYVPFTFLGLLLLIYLAKRRNKKQ